MKRNLLILWIVFFSILLFGCGDDSAVFGGEDDNIFEIPVSGLSDKVSFYKLQDGDVTINFLAVLGSDNLPRTAIDACDICGGYEGYKQVGTDIICNKCGRYFDIDGLGTKNTGYGCWPSYLPHEIKDGKVTIRHSDLKEHRAKFM
jgi:uncharacterized membrane protein